jgi:kinesin family protein C2/C3
MDGDESSPGVTLRAMEEIFEQIEQRKVIEDFEVRVNMVEIYNENVRDLLSAEDSVLEIRQGAQGIHLPNAATKTASNVEDLASSMREGMQHRTTHATNANEHSSRSHSLMIITVNGVNRETNVRSSGKLVLCDLAGSERISKTEATGSRLKEAQNINKSLSALGDVMSALLEKSAHVPFRNSKLTYLLQDVLGGKNKVLMLVNVTPTASSASETVCSLTFAARVKKIQLGKAEVNRKGSNELSKLKSALSKAQDELQDREQLLRQFKQKTELNEGVISARLKEKEQLQQQVSTDRVLSPLAHTMLVAARFQTRSRRKVEGGGCRFGKADQNGAANQIPKKKTRVISTRIR